MAFHFESAGPMEKPIQTNDDDVRYRHIWRAFLLSVFLTAQVHAEAVLDFKITQKQDDSKQTVYLKNDQIWIEALGGDAQLALLYDHKSNQIALIHHARKSYALISQKAIRHLSDQIMLVAPMLKGFGTQLKTLDAAQRAKWEKMLSGIPIDALIKAQSQTEKGHIRPHGNEQHVAEVPCKPYRVSSAEKALGEFCLASPKALALHPEDTQILGDFSSLIHQLLLEAATLLGHTGFIIHQEELSPLEGIPVSWTDGRRSTLTVRLDAINRSPASGRRFEIPEGYTLEKFKLW